MKCSRCGRDLREDHLYCEYCGEEVKIVPDMDIEIENSIQENLSTLIENISKEQGEPGTDSENEGSRNAGKKILLLVMAGTIAAVLLCVFVGINLYHRNSFDYQIKKASACAAGENYREAIRYLEKAVTLQEDNTQARLLLAVYYIKEQDIKQAKQMLRDVISIDAENEEAYSRLIALYEEAQDYAAINRLLQNSGSAAMKEKFRRFLAIEPEFSNAEGSYTEVVALKLSSHTTGEIFYTLDGTVPTKASKRYTTPIRLESGAYDVAAMFVNEYGIESSVVKKHYEIEVAVPLAPEVNCMSGSYDRPTMISVEVPKDCSVYYTMDGSEPTMDSILYSLPIAMPLGSSTFRFVVYSEEGVAGEVTTRNYLLRVHTAVDVATAVNMLMQELKERGVILEFDGSVPNKSGRNVYIASTLIQIGQNDFFLVAEYYQDAIGTLTRTGGLYGVEANTGAIYRISTDDKGNYLANPY